ncbi:HypC/HybG/HupF family hydrogenase formation chaperone [Magnetospira thiophila]
MCIGIPLRIEAMEGSWAICHRDGVPQRVDLSLVDGAAVGTLVLVHLDRAVQILGDQEAQDISNALSALDLVLRGENVDHLFADLVDREPQLPEHLRPSSPCPSTSSG